MKPSLFDAAFDLEPYTFRGERLREIAFPLGGIGTGCVSLDGRGGLVDWEIYNRPNKGSIFQHTFPMLWYRTENEERHALRLTGPRLKNWAGDSKAEWKYGHGTFFDHMDGLPGFDEVEFSGTFPFARLRFHKTNCPLQIQLCAFNPFIPLDIDSSSYPGACLIYQIHNPTGTRIVGTVAWSLLNPVSDGVRIPDGKDQSSNLPFDNGICRGIHFENHRSDLEFTHQGDAVLCTSWRDVALLPNWIRGAWWDAFQAIWNEFRFTGRFEAIGFPASQDQVAGSLGCTFELAPGEMVDIPFYIGWRFPNTNKYWGDEEAKRAVRWSPYYATRWPAAIDSATEFFENFPSLASRTLAFEESLFTSDLPVDVIQSVSATASILHSPTMLRLQDGTFWAWEGCSPQDGCCSGTCTHVWNYALTHAFLFPRIQRSMRQTDYANSFHCGPRGGDGAMNFRVEIPLGTEAPLWHAASDGQLGGVVQLYRDWRLSGDESLLASLWPAAKRALEFAWRQWDKDADGFAESDMHNTYDINFADPNPLTQCFYLAALRAGEEIARHLGDQDTADKYRALYESGRTLTESRLWNGEYLIQENPHTGRDAPKYQHGHGCLSDQLFGQLAASLAGLGNLIEPEMIRSSLQAIFRHNFKRPLGDHENLQRTYAMQDESGLILCSWPNGGRPNYPFVYSDEVWTGIEYQVATHLAYEGFIDEARQIVSAIRKRYDGQRRNPWNEFECGSHYARALAAFGLILALSDVEYDAVDDRLEFRKPKPEGFKCFYAAPRGWGQVVCREGKAHFEMVEACARAK